MDNRAIAGRLTRHAHNLEKERESLYRIRAYRQAAQIILGLDEPVEEIVARDGRKGLQQLDGIGRHLAFTIEQLVRTGEFRTLTRKRPLLSEFQLAASPPAKKHRGTKSCSKTCGESWR